MLSAAVIRPVSNGLRRCAAEIQWRRCAVILAVPLALASIIPSARSASSALAPAINSMLSRNCFDCHDRESKKGELDLESLIREAVTEHSDRWERVVRR